LCFQSVGSTVKDQHKTKARLIEELQELRKELRSFRRCRSQYERLENYLRRKQSEYEMLLESISDGLVVLDEKSRFIHVSGRSIEVTGYSAENLIGRSVHDFVDSEASRLLNNQLELRKKGEISSYELEFPASDGKSVTTLVTGRPLFNDKNKFKGSVAVLTDITRHKRIENALRESEERFRLLAAVTSEGIMFHDKGIITDVNQRLAEMMGYAYDEMIGMDGLSLIDAEYRDIVRRNLYMRHNGPCEAIARKKDGTVFPVEVSGRIFRKDGKSLRIAAFRDITSRKMAEDRLKRTYQKLRLKKSELNEKSIALRTVIQQIEEGKKIIIEEILANIETLIMPALARIKEMSPPSQRTQIGYVEERLLEITSPFVENLRGNFNRLTPREIEICEMIKSGMMSKEISETLNVSLLTVHKHREYIRKKLGLTNKNINLNTFLQSI